MTIASTTAKSGPYNGNGATTTFNYGFKVFAETDLVVTLLNAAGAEVVQTLTTHYSVTGVGNVGGGTIVMVTPPATGEQLVITRAVPLLQGLDLQNRKAVTPELIERSLDLLTQMLQDMNERVDRSLKIDVFETVNLDTLLANVNAVSALASELATVAGISTEVVAVAGDAADIGAVAGVATEVAALAALTSELVALNAIIADISAAAAIGTDISTVAGIAASVVTAAANAASIAAVAAIDADVTAVAAIDTAVTSIAQKYQGASATDPTVRALDGSALQVGDFYLNTGTNLIKYVTSTGPVVWGTYVTLINEATLDEMGVTVTAAELNIGSQALENRIINGAFDWWQRATSSSAGGYVAADRWINSYLGGTVTQSRQAFSPGAVFGQNRPKFRLRQSVSGHTLASHFAATINRIEGVDSYNGKTITVLGFARRNSGSGNMAVELAQYFGSGGSPSASINGIGAQQVALTTDWEPFAAVIAVPSITGKTLGTTGNDFVEVVFWASSGSDYAARSASLGLQTIEVELWGVHIRVGTFAASAAFDYVQPKLDEEFRRCQRYYQRRVHVLRGAQSFGGQVVALSNTIPLMRASPTGVISSASPSGSMNGSPVVASTSPQSFDLSTNAFSVLNTNGAVSFVLSLDAEL